MDIIKYLRAIAVETQKSYFFELAWRLERVKGTVLEKKRFEHAHLLIKKRHEDFVVTNNDKRTLSIITVKKREKSDAVEDQNNAEDILKTL